MLKNKFSPAPVLSDIIAYLTSELMYRPAHFTGACQLSVYVNIADTVQNVQNVIAYYFL